MIRSCIKIETYNMLKSPFKSNGNDKIDLTGDGNGVQWVKNLGEENVILWCQKIYYDDEKTHREDWVYDNDMIWYDIVWYDMIWYGWVHQQQRNLYKNDKCYQY